MVVDPFADPAADPGAEPIDAQVLGSTEIDEGALRRLLRRAGRTLARPAIECLELLLDGNTPPQVRLTMLAALTYLLVPIDLIPDFVPVLGYADDAVIVALALRSVTKTAGPAALEKHWPGTPDGLAAVRRLCRLSEIG